MEYSNVLIQDAINGNEQAFAQLYKQLSGKMYSLCLRYARDSEEANDWFQDGFIKLYRNLSAYRFEGSFEGWARRIFVTTCLDALKKNAPVVQEMNDDLTIYDSGPDINDKLDYEELFRLIQTLPDAHRTMINLYLIEDYSHKEIGSMLQISESNSKSRLHKARAVLKEKLAEQLSEHKRRDIKAVN